MATENNSQVNVFVKGMNTDLSYQMIQEGQYTFGQNIRINALNQTGSSDTNNAQGEVRPIEGVVNVGSFSYDSILAVNTIRNIGCVIYTKDGTWRIGRFENKIGDNVNKDDLIQSVEIQEILNTGQATDVQKFSTVLRYENENNVMLYIADGENPLFVVNLFGDYSNMENPLEHVRIYPKVNYTPFKFEGLVDGSLQPALVQYSYQLYNKYQNYTNISPCTNLIPIVQKNGDYGYLKESTSGSGVKLSLHLQDNEYFNNIAVYRITYKEIGQPPLIELIYDGNIKGAEQFIDSGLVALQTLSLEEYNSMSGVHIIPKVIESKNDFLFAGNIKDKTSWLTKEEIENQFVWSEEVELVAKTNDTDTNADKAIIKLQGENNYKRPEIIYNNRSLRNGETYRYGIVFYNKYGETSDVYHLKDVDVEYTDDLFEVVNNTLKTKSIGITIHISSLPEGTVAYEIVRCNRTEEDVRSLMQGVLSRPGKAVDADEEDIDKLKRLEYFDLYTPVGYLTTNNLVAITDDYCFGNDTIDDFTYKNSENVELFNFISPEVAYLPEASSDLLKGKDIKITPIKLLFPSYDILQSHDDQFIKPSQDCIIKSGMFDRQSQTIKMKQDQPTARHENFDYFFCPFSILDGFIENVFGDGKKIMTKNERAKAQNYSYIKLYNQQEVNNTEGIKIEEYKLANNVPFDKLLTGKSNQDAGVIYSMHDYIQAIGTMSYDNIVSYGCDIAEVNEVDSVRPFGYMYASFGPNILLVLKNGSNLITNEPFGTFLCDIRKETIPYGGENTIEYSTYYSYGQYFDANEANPEVFDGDCITWPFEYVSMYKQYSSAFDIGSTLYDDIGGRSHCMVYSIPVQTSIMLPYTSGFEFSRNADKNVISNIQLTPAQILGLAYDYQQTKPMYVYNDAYGSNSTIRAFSAYQNYENEDENVLNKYDTRIYYSGPKTNNEKINSWNKFQANNYIDLDNKYGQLTHIRQFNNRLVFWQEQAFGLLSVNERTQITDDSNLPLILGTGGVLDRYDYLDNTAGMYKEQYCDAASSSTLYWFDESNQELKAYSGDSILPLSKVYGVQNLMHRGSNTQKKPWLFFDKKYNELVANVLDDTKGSSVVYNEQARAFTSVYTFDFDGSATFANGLYIFGHNVSQWNAIQEDTPRGLSGEILKTKLQYVVNKQPTITKVFDNQEIVTANKVLQYTLEPTHIDELAYFSKNHNYKWFTDLQESDVYTLENQMTLREGNYRYAVPRAKGNVEYGNRMRGKYMVCNIECDKPDYDASITYIITKFRTSWS